MASFIEGVSNTIQGLFQSIFAIIQAFFNVIYSLVNGIFTFAWGVLESIGSFIGASAHFVYANFIVIGIIILIYIAYQDRNKRGASENLKKKI